MSELAGWIACGTKVLGVAALALGVLSAWAPARSIGLYQWIMVRFNWRVTPIDVRRELRTTRLLGVVLIGLGAATFVLLF